MLSFDASEFERQIKYYRLPSQRNSKTQTNAPIGPWMQKLQLLEAILWTKIKAFLWNEKELISRTHTHTHIYIYIYIYIYHHHHHIVPLSRYPWPSLASSPYRSSPLADLQGYIPYPHIAAVCMFELVSLLLPGHMWRSIGVNHFWAHPCFSSSVLHLVHENL